MPPAYENIWNKIAGQTPPNLWMGHWINYRKMATVAYIPNADVRAMLRGLYAFELVFNFALAAGETQYDRVVTGTDCFITAYIASATRESAQGNLGSFRAQFNIGTRDPRSAYQTSDKVINQACRFGTALRPSWIKRPLFVKAKTPILAVCQNFDVDNANTVQLVLHAYGG